MDQLSCRANVVPLLFLFFFYSILPYDSPHLNLGLPVRGLVINGFILLTAIVSCIAKSDSWIDVLEKINRS